MSDEGEKFLLSPAFPWMLIVPKVKRTCTLRARISGRLLSACHIVVTHLDQRDKETTDPYIHTLWTTEASVLFSKSPFWWQLLVLTCSQSIHTVWDASGAACIFESRHCVCLSVSVLEINMPTLGYPQRRSPVSMGNSPRQQRLGCYMWTSCQNDSVTPLILWYLEMQTPCIEGFLCLFLEVMGLLAFFPVPPPFWPPLFHLSDCSRVKSIVSPTGQCIRSVCIHLVLCWTE